MSDARERRAVRNGDEAAAQRERCRRGEHALERDQGALFVRSAWGEPDEFGRACRACGAWVTDPGLTISGSVTTIADEAHPRAPGPILRRMHPSARSWHLIDPYPLADLPWWELDCPVCRRSQWIPLRRRSENFYFPVELVTVRCARLTGGTQDRPVVVFVGACEACGTGYRSRAFIRGSGGLA